MGNKVKPWHNPEKRPREFTSVQDDRKGKGYRNKRERQEQQTKRIDPRRFTTEF